MRPQRQRRRPPQAPVNKYVKAQTLTVIDDSGEKLGVLSYAELEDNFNIDWADMSKPYETQEEIEKAISLN